MALDIGWLTICREEASIDLFRTVWEASRRGAIDVRIRWLFVNRRPGKSPVTDRLFALAKELGVPALWFPAREFKWDLYQRDRERWTLECDREYMSVLDRAGPVDLMVLGRFMHICGPEMCDRYTMLNLHHAVPWGPKRSLDEVLWEHVRNRDAEAGTMLHVVTPDLDRGPPIAYFRLPIGPRAQRYRACWAAMGKRTVEELQADGRAGPFFDQAKADIFLREGPFVTEVLRKLAAGEVVLKDKVPLFPERKLEHGLDLTDFVEASLRSPVVRTRTR